MRSYASAAALFVLSGCVVTTANPDTDRFACRGPDDCGSGYGCNLVLGTCAKQCGGTQDCPSTAPSCVDGLCGDACAEKQKECAQQNQVCVIQGTTPVCKSCDQNNFNCNNSNLVCVANTGGAVCADVCDSGNVCNWTSGTALCVKIKQADPSKPYMPVCVPCPISCPSTCIAVATSQADTYSGGVTCPTQGCTTNANCTGAAGDVCIDGTCRQTCSGASGCPTDSACVTVTSTSGNAQVCKACDSACSTGSKVCVPSNPATTTSYANTAVNCADAGWLGAFGAGSGIVGQNATDVALTFDAAGNPVVAWTMLSATSPTVMRGDAGTQQWSSLGANPPICTTPHSPPDVASPTLAVYNGMLRIAWEQTCGTNTSPTVYLAVLDTSVSPPQWASEQIAETTTTSTLKYSGISDGFPLPNVTPRLSTGSYPSVIWQSVTSTGGIGARYLTTTSSWKLLGSNGQTPPAFGLASYGTPGSPVDPAFPVIVTDPSSSASYAAWQALGSSGLTVFARKIANQTDVWGIDSSTMPNGSDTGSGVPALVPSTTWISAGRPQLALDSAGYPVLAWEGKVSAVGATSIYMAHVDPSQQSWRPLGLAPLQVGEAGTPAPDAVNASLAYYRAGNRPIVAYNVDHVVRRVFVRQLRGSVWEEIAGSATGEGLSDPAELLAGPPALAIDEVSTPNRACVAWTVGTGTTNKVVVRCHPISP